MVNSTAITVGAAVSTPPRVAMFHETRDNCENHVVTFLGEKHVIDLR